MRTHKSVTAAKAADNKTNRENRRGRASVRDSKKFSPDPKMEKLAEEVVSKFSGICAKLKELKPKIEQIQSYFQKNVRGSVTLAGCGSFKQFCETRLHRTEQAVYKLLSGGIKKPTEKKAIPKAPAPTAYQKPGVSGEDIERMRDACHAATRYFDAETEGDKAKAQEAREAFRTIARAESLKPLIGGDQPNPRLMLFDLLAAIGKLNEKHRLPKELVQMAAMMRKRLGIDAESFGIPPEQDPPAAAAKHSGRPMARARPSGADPKNNAESSVSRNDERASKAASAG